MKVLPGTPSWGTEATFLHPLQLELGEPRKFACQRPKQGRGRLAARRHARELVQEDWRMTGRGEAWEYGVADEIRECGTRDTGREFQRGLVGGFEVCGRQCGDQ